jgi:hypothetical protein
METLYQRTNIETGEIDMVTEAEVRSDLKRYADNLPPWDFDEPLDTTPEDHAINIALNIDHVMEIIKSGKHDPQAASTDLYEFATLN